MLTQEMEEILARSQSAGWVTEPDAKQLFALAGLPVPRNGLFREHDDALEYAGKIGYPLVGKVVSPRILHKSDVGGVAVGISGSDELSEVYRRFSAMDGFEGILVEEMASGVELIVGAKIDYQFGPIVLFGLGGTAVEVYQDVALRMLPITGRDVDSMLECLKAGKLLSGYRGAEPVDREALSGLLIRFSDLVMSMADRIESVDLNPVMCKGSSCIVADARILLNRKLQAPTPL